MKTLTERYNYVSTYDNTKTIDYELNIDYGVNIDDLINDLEEIKRSGTDKIRVESSEYDVRFNTVRPATEQDLEEHRALEAKRDEEERKSKLRRFELLRKELGL